MELNKFSLSRKIIEILLIFLPISLLLSNIIAELIVFLLIIFYISIQKFTDVVKDLKNPIILFLLIVWIYLFINYFINIDEEPSFLRTIFFLRFPLLILSISFFFNSLKINQKRIFKFWFVIILIVCIDLFIQYFNKVNITGNPAILQGNLYRLGGFMGDELKISNLLFHFGAIVFSYLFSNKIKENKISLLSILFLFFIIISIFITAERSNFITVAIFFIFFNFFLFFINKKFSLIIFTFLSITLIFLSLSNKELSNRMTSTVVKELKNFNFQSNKSFLNKDSHYFAHYSTAYQLFERNIFFGIGLKNFRNLCDNDEFNKEIHETWHKKKCATHPHNYYFEFLSELGLIGFLFYISFFIYSFYKFLKSKNYFIILSSLILLVNFIPFLPRGSFFTNWNAIIFWTIFAFIFSKYVKFKNQND